MQYLIKFKLRIVIIRKKQNKKSAIFKIFFQKLVKIDFQSLGLDRLNNYNSSQL